MNLSTIPDHYDEFHGAFARNIGRILIGRRFRQEPDADEFAMTPGYDITVTELAGDHAVVVGIDSAGIFAGITVRDLTEIEWTFYADGRVVNGDDATVGTHQLALGPDPSPVVGRTRPEPPSEPLFDLAVGLTRAQWPEAS